MTIFVIDNVERLPAGQQFQSRTLGHKQAVAELKRDKDWRWDFENETGEKIELLDTLWREAGGRKHYPGFRLEDHKLDRKLRDPERMKMAGSKFLLIRDDLTYEFFTLAESAGAPPTTAR